MALWRVLWANPTKSVGLIKLSPGERVPPLRWEEGGAAVSPSLDARGGADTEQVARLPHGPRQEAAPFTGHRGPLCLAAPCPRASPPKETDRAAVVQN